MAPRIILYTGKGGVGKTSVAAATALRCASEGLRTVVLSTDPAHSLSDSFETPLGAEPTPLAENLFGHEVQAQEEMERHWDGVQAWLGDLLAKRGVDRISAEELTVPPGMDELSHCSGSSATTRRAASTAWWWTARPRARRSASCHFPTW